MASPVLPGPTLQLRCAKHRAQQASAQHVTWATAFLHEVMVGSESFPVIVDTGSSPVPQWEAADK